MFHGKKIVVVMPAYNAARTLEKTYREIPLDLVDEVRAGAMAYVTVFEEGLAGYSMKIAAILRAAGIDTEIDTMGGKLAKQLKRADKRGCRFAAVAGPDESESGQVVLKDMKAHTQATVSLEGAVEMVASLLETAPIRED